MKPQHLKKTEEWHRPSTQEELIEWISTKSRDFMLEYNKNRSDDCSETRLDHSRQVMQVLSPNYQGRRRRTLAEQEEYGDNR